MSNRVIAVMIVIGIGVGKVLPGAKMSIQLPMSEKYATLSLTSVAPTLMALGAALGDPWQALHPSLPAATETTMLWALTSCSTAITRESSEQSPSQGPPRLILTWEKDEGRSMKQVLDSNIAD